MKNYTFNIHYWNYPSTGCRRYTNTIKLLMIILLFCLTLQWIEVLLLKNVLATLEVQPRVKTIFMKTAGRLFHPTHHTQTTHNLVEKKEKENY